MTVDGTSDAITVDQVEIEETQQTTDAEPDNQTSLTAGPGNLGLVMQIIAQMCDGQNKDLQVRVTISVNK